MTKIILIIGSPSNTEVLLLASSFKMSHAGTVVESAIRNLKNAFDKLQIPVESLNSDLCLLNTHNIPDFDIRPEMVISEPYYVRFNNNANKIKNRQKL